MWLNSPRKTMEWAEDLFTLKKSAKKGRRAAAAAAESSIPSTTLAAGPTTIQIPLTSPTTTTTSSRKNSLDDDLDAFETQQTTMPTKPRRTGGWADEPIKSGKAANKANASNLIEKERFGSSPPTTLSDDIPIIPDLDDLPDDLLNEMIDAAALPPPPVVSVNRVTTYKELNSDLLKQGAFASLEDIDLSVLARCLQPESALTEPDDVWTWEHLFGEVAAEIHADQQKIIDAAATQFVN